MTPDAYPQQSAALCDICHLFGERRWCLATSGNFSLRVSDTHCLITQSGKDKSRLTKNDLMICDTDGQAIDANLVPSAETALHAYLYRRDPAIGAVLHTHSVAATLASRATESAVTMQGFEMQKALQGVTTHDTAIAIPVFENSQNMHDLIRRLQTSLDESAWHTPGFLVRGHGLYAWGDTLADAQRHTEGLEFLLDCAWQEMIR
jgi:methylthioribulose-1-phosphate dehydratase